MRLRRPHEVVISPEDIFAQPPLGSVSSNRQNYSFRKKRIVWKCAVLYDKKADIFPDECFYQQPS
jgi:hypothetical protein